MSLKLSTPAYKLAETPYPVLDVIKARWSPRAFDTDRSVDQAQLFSILEAGRWAPSSFNEQPWRFIVGDTTHTPETHKLLQDILVDGNSWAKQVPVLLLAVAKNHFTQTGDTNRHSWHDVGMALENMALQATAIGLQSHFMAGFYADKAAQTFDIPSGDYTPVVVMAIGYAGEPKQLKEQWQQQAEIAERHRKPLQETVFTGTWQRPYPGVFS